MRVALRKRGDVIAKKATTIAIVNQKGGTAKTTTCENLGIGLAMEGKKVLLVDVDPQGSLTISMGWQQPDELSTTLSTLMQKAMNDQPIQPGDGILHHAEGVDLIPANIELAGMEVALVNSMNREKMLKQVLDSAKREYDYILLDCTPSLGMLTINALAAADTTLIPMQAQYLSAKGLEQLLQTIGKVRRQINPKLKIEGILLTMTDSRTTYGKQIDNLIRQGYGRKIHVFEQTIPHSVRAAEISTTGESIYQHDPKGKVAAAYQSLTREVLATNFGEAWRLAEGKELGDKIMSMVGTLPLAFANPLPSLHPLDLLIGFFCGAGLRLAVYLRSKNAKKYRHGMEYGSARWGTPKDIEPFQAPKFADNIILTKTERLMMSNRPPDPKNARNKNVLVVGGSGSGKTRFWLKPNLLQCHSSYVVTDPKGSIVVECGNALLKNGYKVKILNTINFKKSMHYNPFSYVHSEKDILKLVTTLMTNTKGEGSGGDPFWEKSERLLLTALIAYLHYEAPVEEQNFATLLEMLNTMQVLEDDEEYQNPVDLLFEELAKKKPNSFAGRQYKLYKLAAGKTAKSILISCGARLAPFDIQELRDLTMYDELQLDTLGDKKTALFLIMSDTDSTFNFLISMVYTQLFNLLCDKADDVYGGKLPIHVRCLIDECANIGQIPNLEKLVATIRSREISACLVLQARSQLKAIYKDNADTIVGNMDSQIFLGGSEPTTLKDLSEMLGKETIDSFNTSDTRGNSPSYGTTFQKMGHELLSRDELAVLDGGKCILQLRGVRPFLSDKYDLTQHPNYRLTSDYDPKNTFDIEKYLNRKEKIHPDDEFIVVDADSLPSA